MKKILATTLLYLSIGSTSIAQWSTFAGGGVNMTTDCKTGANLGSVINLSLPYQREWYISKGFGGGGGIGCSYLT